MYLRRAASVALGVGVGMGAVEPGMDYYRAITDGEGEALLMKAKQKAAGG